MATFGFGSRSRTALGTFFAAASVAFFGLAASHAAAAEPGPTAGTSPTIATAPLPGLLLQTGPTVSIGCANAGSSQDIVKTPVLKNTASVPLAKGTALSWSASDGDASKLVLDADLPVGATLKVQGTRPGNAYRCSASYLARPDLRIKRVYLSGPMQATVEVFNADPYADAAPSKVRLDIGVCNSTLTQTLESAPVAVAKGETKAVTFTFNAMFGKLRYVAWADVGKSVNESYEKNNGWHDPSLCM